MALYPVHTCAKPPVSRRDLANSDFHRNCTSVEEAADELASLAGEFDFVVFRKGSTWFRLNDIGEIEPVTFH